MLVINSASTGSGTFEATARNCHKLGDALDIPVGIEKIDVANIGRKHHHRGCHLATIGGFDLIYEGERFGKGDGYRFETLLQRTGADYEVDLAIKVTPLGAISRLEHGLDGFDDEQRQYRRRLDEAERRLNSYQSRIGGAFQFAEELGAKRKQLREIEEELAASAIVETDQIAA